MKIKTDFVTNSSSTSFILACDAEFTLEEFMKLMGIDKESPLAPIFQRLFSLIRERMKPITDSELQIKIEESHPNVAQKLINARNTGKNFYEGELGTEDGDELESMFCVDSFEVENEHIYLNYLECVW
jgi:hypothetical protein